MDPERSTPAEDRRRFLARVGATIAAGVGLAAFGAQPAGARRSVSGLQSCDHYCRMTECWSASCSYPYRHLVECFNACGGGNYSYCSDRTTCPVGTWCVEPVCS